MRTGPAHIALATVLCGLATPALAQTGNAAALGSDTLSLNGRAFQLFGIDGLEFNQSCFVDGQPLACGATATRALQILLDPAAVTCTPTGGNDGTALLARCEGHDGDIGLKLVEQGWALADRTQSDEYAAAEDAARAAAAGVWRGSFISPLAYRGEIAAIEANYAQRAGEATRADVEAAITTGNIGVWGLAGFRVTTAPAAPDELANHEVRVGDFKPGFIAAAIAPPAVFDWNAVAATLETTRQTAVAALEQSAVDTVWSALHERPAETVPVIDSRGFYNAIRAASADWIASGRQPILFVTTADVPSWIHDWFAGDAPTGAQLTTKEGLGTGYLGTVDGVDIYVGPARDLAALLFPADLLAEVSYRARDDGNVVGLQIDPAAGNEWVLQYGLTLRWRDDTVTWIEYPRTAAGSLDAS